MDQRDHYRDFERPAPIEDLSWWYEITRNIVVAAGVTLFMLSVVGVLVVKVAETRQMKQPKWPPADFASDSAIANDNSLSN